MTHGTYTDGSGTGSGTGSQYELRFGEEVLPGLTLGFTLGGGQAFGNSDRYEVAFGGLSMEAGWRPLEPPLFLLISTGIGGGTITPKSTDDEADEQSVAGAYYRLGIHYDFDWSHASRGGFILSPSIRGHFIPASGGAEASITAVVTGLELTWAFGREESD